jgi:DNA-binding response OmpR family regulator
MNRILVVEDDPDIADLIARYLQKSGYDVEVRSNGRDAHLALAERPPDVVVLDLMLPHLGGLELCRLIRANEKTASIPVIMVTARADEAERIAGLDMGADDYLGKPFSPGELVARVRAVLRRSTRTPTAPPPHVAYGPLVIDSSRHTVTCAGVPVMLTAKEYLLLQYLVSNRGHVLSRDLLLTDVWGYTYTGGTRTVDVHVRRLREKLPLLADALVTVKQFGYKLLEKPPEVSTGAGEGNSRQPR